MTMPGEDGTVTVRFIKPQALEAGQTFTLRDAAHTVGTGKVSQGYNFAHCSAILP